MIHMPVQNQYACMVCMLSESIFRVGTPSWHNLNVDQIKMRQGIPILMVPLDSLEKLICNQFCKSVILILYYKLPFLQSAFFLGNRSRVVDFQARWRISTLRAIDFRFFSKLKEFNHTDDFLLIVNQTEFRFVDNQKEIIGRSYSFECESSWRSVSVRTYIMWRQALCYGV